MVVNLSCFPMDFWLRDITFFFLLFIYLLEFLFLFFSLMWAFINLCPFCWGPSQLEHVFILYKSDWTSLFLLKVFLVFHGNDIPNNFFWKIVQLKVHEFQSGDVLGSFGNFSFALSHIFHSPSGSFYEPWYALASFSSHFPCHALTFVLILRLASQQYLEILDQSLFYEYIKIDTPTQKWLINIFSFIFLMQH